MSSIHWVTLAAGIAIGWFVLPMVLGMIGSHSKGQPTA